MLFEFGEWLPDQHPVRLPGLVDVENAVPLAQGYRAMSDARVLASASALDAAVQGAGRGKTRGGVVFLVAGTATKLWLAQAGGDFVDRSGAVYALGRKDRWSFTLYENRLIAVAPATPPRVYNTWGGAGNFGLLSTDASIAKSIMTFHEFVVLGNLVGQGVNAAPIGTSTAGVHWCAIGDPTSWPTIGTQAALDVQSDWNNLPGDGGDIIDMVSAGEWALIFREREIWRMDYVGAPAFFEFRLLDAHRGCDRQGSALAFGGAVYFHSEDGFFVCDGANEARSIGEQKVDDFFIRIAGDGLMSVAHDSRRSLALWKVPGTDIMLGYQFELQRWCKIRKNVEFIMTALVGGITSVVALDEAPYATMSMDAPSPGGLGDVNLDSVAVGESIEVLGAFMQDHRLYLFDDAEQMTAVLETGDFIDENNGMKRSLVRSVRPIVTGEGVAVAVSLAGRDLPADPVVFTPLAGPNPRGVFPARVAGRFLRARLSFSGDFTTTAADAVIAALGGR